MSRSPSGDVGLPKVSGSQAWESFERSKLRNHLLFEHFCEVGSADALVVFDDRVEFALCLFGNSDLGHRVLLGLFRVTTMLEASLDLVERHGLSFAGLR